MEKKPKILYLVTQSEWGGAQRYVFDLASSLRADFEVAVAAGAPRDGALFKALETKGVPTIKLKNLVREIKPISDLRAFLEIRNLLKQVRPKILHTNSAKAGFLGALAAARLDIKVVYTVHGWTFLEPLPALARALYLLAEKIACRYRHATILLSQYEKNIAEKYNLSCGITAVIPHGIDLPKFWSREESRRTLSAHLQSPVRNDVPWIGTIANLYKTKDIPNLIAALSLISEKYCAIIIGDGPERKKIEQLIKDNNLTDRVYLTGRLSYAECSLPAFDIFVLPSAKEGLPYALLEAMAAGLPIIATEVGAIPEMIENKKTGLLVPPRNTLKLQSAIERMIFDKNFRISAGTATKLLFEKQYLTERMIKQTKEIYFNFSSLSPIN